jgi:hypothetical protein
MRKLASCFCLVTALLAGCATTTVETTGQPLGAAPCQGDQALPIAVYWGTRWRPDQKEPPLREAAALQGIQDFLARTGCFRVVAIDRLSTAQTKATDEELNRLASGSTVKPDRVLLIVVRELGPRILVGIPVIVAGGTEVLIDVRLIDTRTSQPLAATQTLWRHGGTFVIKGVKTLDQDMSAALRAALRFDQTPL